MPHLDLGSYLSDDTLVLDGIASKKHPDGKSYSVPSPSAVDGLRLQRIMAAGGGGPTAFSNPSVADDLRAFCTGPDGDTISADEKLLGPAYQEMMDDGVSAARLGMIVSLVMTHYSLGAEVAELVVAAAGEAPAPEPGATRAAEPSPTGKKRTPRSTAGSASTSGRSGTPARPRARTSTRSSTKRPPSSEAPAMPQANSA